MKALKILAAILLVFAALTSFAACGAGKVTSEPENEENPVESESSEVSSEAEEGASSAADDESSVEDESSEVIEDESSESVSTADVDIVGTWAADMDLMPVLVESLEGSGVDGEKFAEENDLTLAMSINFSEDGKMKMSADTESLTDDLTAIIPILVEAMYDAYVENGELDGEEIDFDTFYEMFLEEAGGIENVVAAFGLDAISESFEAEYEYEFADGVLTTKMDGIETVEPIEFENNSFSMDLGFTVVVFEKQ